MKSSPLFGPLRGNSTPLEEKQILFLAVAGAKPVSAPRSCHWVRTEHGGHSAPDDQVKVAGLLEQLGLSYIIELKKTLTMAYVSLQRTSLDHFLADRGNDRETGRWFGYPMTAVEAFVAGDSMAIEEQQAAEQALGVPVFSTFRLSRTNAAVELELMRQWWLILERYGLIEA